MNGMLGLGWECHVNDCRRSLNQEASLLLRSAFKRALEEAVVWENADGLLQVC